MSISTISREGGKGMNALAAFCISGKLFCEDASDSIALGRQRWTQLYGETGNLDHVDHHEGGDDYYVNHHQDHSA